MPQNITNTSALPVKTWIYGGAETAGSISDRLYDGCNLAAMSDSIVVSINYRLGPLGWLSLPEAGIDGNFGIQDIIMGLEWIQSNIAAFGGDAVSSQGTKCWLLRSIDIIFSRRRCYYSVSRQVRPIPILSARCRRLLRL